MRVIEVPIPVCDKLLKNQSVKTTSLRKFSFPLKILYKNKVIKQELWLY